MSNYGHNIPVNGPNRRKIDARSLSYALEGPIKPYPVYQFSGGRFKLEYDRHNPFGSIWTADSKQVRADSTVFTADAP